MSKLGNIKGVAFGEFLGWCEKRNGRPAAESAVRAVEGRHRVALDEKRAGFGVLASRWYPAESVHDLVDELTRGRSTTELDAMAKDAAEFIMGRTLKGVYRAVFSMFGTPERYARHINKLWAMHYDTGLITVDDSAERFHRVCYTGWLGHHPFICRMNMASSLSLYGAMGCKGVEYERVRCLSTGGAICENVVRWKG